MENKISKFRFKGFSIFDSKIEIKNDNAIAPNMSLDFDLSGEHMSDDCCYNLYMKIKVVYANKKVKANIEACPLAAKIPKSKDMNKLTVTAPIGSDLPHTGMIEFDDMWGYGYVIKYGKVVSWTVFIL